MVSCQKDFSNKAVRFSAQTRPEASFTKTAYSGITGSKERIDWMSGDVIRMYSDKARTSGSQDYADYTVDESSITAASQYSQTKLSGSGLMWGDGLGSYHFWGIYPAHVLDSGTGTVSGLSISATQDVSDGRKTETADATIFAPDMSSAWMLADTPGVTEGASNFTMDFYPAFTAFQFSLASQFATTITVKSFTLTSADTDIAGTFGATLAAAGATTYDCPATGSHSISVSFGTGVDITNTKALQFTVLALPRNIPNLSITFVVDVNGSEITRTLALKTVSPDAFITFDKCKKHKINGLVLPSGALQMSVGVAEWIVGAADYNFISSVSTSLKCISGETYRRYDSDSDYGTWVGSNIVVSYGYKNDSNEIVITDNPEEYQDLQHTLLRPAYSPILELATTSDPGNVLQLQLDNPHFKFIQYGNSGGLPTGGIDMGVRDHSKTDHLDVVSGTGVKTFFSVVPVEQFPVDAADADRTCRISLLSVSPGTLHEIPFNMTDDVTPVQALPGENMMELKFKYFGPAVYSTTGNGIVIP